MILQWELETMHPNHFVQPLLSIPTENTPPHSHTLPNTLHNRRPYRSVLRHPHHRPHSHELGRLVLGVLHLHQDRSRASVHSSLLRPVHRQHPELVQHLPLVIEASDELDGGLPARRGYGEEVFGRGRLLGVGGCYVVEIIH